MELVYSIGKSGRWVGQFGSREDTTLCSLSPRNVIAFTTTMDLLDQSSSTRYLLTTYKVYVCDLNSPWNVYRVTSSEEPMVTLDWDVSGNCLLMADAAGTVQIWTMKNYLLNDWVKACNTSITGETIVAMTWLHKGGKVNFLPEKKDASTYSEKMIRTKFSPSLSQIGGVPTVGIVAVTATGMVYVGLPSGNNINLVSEPLGMVRKHMAVADIAFSSTSEIYIIGSDSSINSPIYCFRLSLKPEPPQLCSITVRACHSFYVQCHTDFSMKNSPTAKITHIKFRSRERGDSVVVATGDSTTSKFELWNLKTQAMNISQPLLCGMTDNQIKLPCWSCVGSIQHGSLPVSIAVPRFPVTPPSPESSSSTLLQSFAISYKDGALKLINANTFQPIATTNLDTGAVDMESNEKRRKVIPYMVVMQQTFSGCGIIGLDQFCTLYVMKAINTRDPVTQMSPAFIVSMFEYMLITGLDWWDVLLALRPGMIESVVQKLTDNFEKQSLAHQELLYSHFMSIKASLYSNAVSGQQRAADTLTKVVLHSIAGTFKTLIRPKGLLPNETSPIDRLSTVCSTHFEAELGKMLLMLGPESDFAVEASILQSVQQLIQWLCELVLYILATLPMSYSSSPGSTIIHDSAMLCSIREMLLLIRIWGASNPACLPKLTTMSANFDALSKMFRLITRVWLALREGSSFDHDESLVDDCCLLPSQVFLPGMDQAHSLDHGQSGTILSQSHTCKFDFGLVPDFARESPRDMILYGNASPQQKRDIVRQINLGTTPGEELRQCSRCGSYSLNHSIAKSPVMKGWEQQWIKMCLCGGHWKLVVPDT